MQIYCTLVPQQSQKFTFGDQPNLELLWKIGLLNNKKAQLTQGLRTTAVRVYRHLGFLKFESCTISSAIPENPSLEPNMEWIGCTVFEIFTFKLYCDLETGVRGH